MNRLLVLLLSLVLALPAPAMEPSKQHLPNPKLTPLAEEGDGGAPSSASAGEAASASARPLRRARRGCDAAVSVWPPCPVQPSSAARKARREHTGRGWALSEAMWRDVLACVAGSRSTP